MRGVRQVLVLFGVVVAAVVPCTATEVAADPGPPARWVKTEDDSVVSLATHNAVRPAAESSVYQAIVNGEGFFANDLNFAQFTIRLLSSPEGDIEVYRANLEQTAFEISSQSPIIISVAPGSIPYFGDAYYIDPPPGEIYVIISTSSGCGLLQGGALGCGGTDDYDFIEGEFRSTSGVVWLSPTMQSKCRPPVASHEIGHALGLDHFNSKYLNKYQLMKSTTNCTSPLTFQAGDVNGLNFTGQGSEFNDNIVSAERVCPYHDTLVFSTTWFATAQVGEPQHASVFPHRSVWYRFTAAATGQAVIKTTNSYPSTFDTVLAVYTSNVFPGATPLVSNDNDVGTNSKVTFTAVDGTTYWIAVDGTGVSRGETDIDFNITPGAVPVPAVGVPIRLLDTRRGGETIDCYDEAIGRGGPGIYELQVAGRSWVSGSAKSVILNVTALSPSERGFMTVYPCDAPGVPNASNLNFAAGDVIPNLVITKVAADGTVCVYTSQELDFLVDISGQFLNTTTFDPLSQPVRLLDTRAGGATADGQHAAVGMLSPNVAYELPVAGRSSIPASPEAVVLNVTALSPVARGFLTVYPCGPGEPPNVSNLNFVAGDVIPNLVIATPGVDGKVCLISSVATNLLVDASGSFKMSSAMNALPAPERLLDTRSGGDTIDDLHEGTGRIAANGTYMLPVVSRGAMIANPVSVILNVTAANPNARGFLTVYPCDQPRPNASNLNFLAGDVIPNSVVAKVSATGTVCFFSSANTDLIVDVSGYFTP